MQDWKQELEQAARAAKAEVLGVGKIKHVQHALLVTTALRAFGDDNRATFYVEVLPPKGNIPRPDLILLHPLVGVIVIENKGVALADVQAVNDTTLTLVRDGRMKEEDPFLQAERVMFRLSDLTAGRVDLSEVLFLSTAALPRIGREAFERHFGTTWPDQTLFAEECADPAGFRSHVVGFSDYRQRAARRREKLSRRAHEAVMTVLSGKGFLFPPRKAAVEAANPELLGVRVQAMELAMKAPTNQQRELGVADLRGSHRLFRGVAGSGKSIMLALSVAATLTRYREESETLFGGRKARVLVCCYNRTLVHYLRQRIDDRFGRLAWDKPDPESLAVTHFDGLVKKLVTAAPALDTKLTFKERAERARRMAAALDALDPVARERLLYDAVYVDEAQDLDPAEIQLLLRLARKDEKGGQTLILFYDNAQNIYGVRPPVWTELGVNIVGRTEFLDLCLRNTKELLSFAFNVLVGSFAPEGQRVHTRQFADVASLRQRGLVEERGGRFDVNFAPRTGPFPQVRVCRDRRAEVDAAVEEVRRLVVEQRVLPSDILVLYWSHWPFKPALPEKLQRAVGGGYRLRLVDQEHDANKNLPLLEEGVLVASTVASAKGYDAPVVLLLGADGFGVEPKDRAKFYVGATRAKLHLVVSGVPGPEPTLFDEIVATAEALSPASVARLPPAGAGVTSGSRCRHCGGARLHAQHGQYGYFYRCIDCTQNTPIDKACDCCGKDGRIRKQGERFYRDCGACGRSALIHTNLPLASL